MKHIIILTFSLFVTFPLFSQYGNASETTTYYLIRHAEKDRSDASNKNPHLIEKGNNRAKHWSTIFKNVAFDAIYSTDYNRTRETAQSTATKNNVELTLYHPNINVTSFINETKDKIVLVVGHSNTIPQFVNALIGKEKYDDIDDSNNGNLYIVTVSGSGETSGILLTID